MSVPITKLFTVPEIRKRILITLGLLFAYRVGFYVPLPGVDTSRVFDADSAGSLFGMMNVLTGGQLQSGMLFSLGVMPYISASIIFSLLVKVVPSMERLQKEGASGQRKINQYTRLATIPICMLQSLFVILGTFKLFGDAPSDLVLQSAQNNALLYSIMVMVALTAGTMFIMWLGEQITEHGIGNGISLIIMAGIISSLWPSVSAYVGNLGSDNAAWQTLLLFLGAWIVAVVAVVFMTKAQRRIPIQQAKQTRGRRVYGGQRHFLPLKVNSAGVMPIIFASALLLIPALIGSVTGWNGLKDAFSSGRGFWYVTTFAGLIFFFAFFWTSLMFQPNEIANNLKEHGSFIPGIRPGKHTAEFLEGTMFRITLAGGAFLALVSVFPNIVTGAVPAMSTGQNLALVYFMSGTSILIVVGVALDLVEKLNVLLIQRNYEGFMKESSSGGVGWGRRTT